MLLGDGVLVDGRWQVDGLAAWPWRELRERALTDDDLRRLLSLRASSDHSVEENVLVHFLGWAVVFDLYRESGRLDWRAWLESFRAAPDPIAEARRRLNHTLEDGTPLDWLSRLDDPDPAVRLAAAKGTWKLRSPEVLRLLLEHLRQERDPEVRIGLAVNALAGAGEVRLGWRTERRLWPRVLRTLRDADPPDPAEQDAAHELYAAYARFAGRKGTEPPLQALARYWQE